MGASSDYYRYEHVYKDKGTTAKKIKFFTKISIQNNTGDEADGPGNSQGDKEAYYKVTNLNNKDFTLVNHQ